MHENTLIYSHADGDIIMWVWVAGSPGNCQWTGCYIREHWLPSAAWLPLHKYTLWFSYFITKTLTLLTGPHWIRKFTSWKLLHNIFDTNLFHLQMQWFTRGWSVKLGMDSACGSLHIAVYWLPFGPQFMHFQMDIISFYLVWSFLVLMPSLYVENENDRNIRGSQATQTTCNQLNTI